jgi:hypothetical protein
MSETSDDPSHVLLIGLPTLRRLFDGQAVWIEAAQAGAIAAEDLRELKQEVAAMLLQIEYRQRRLQSENYNCDANILVFGECAKLLRKMVHLA